MAEYLQMNDEQYREHMTEELAAIKVTAEFPAHVSYGAVIFSLGTALANIAWETIEVGDLSMFLQKTVEYAAFLLDKRLADELNSPSELVEDQPASQVPTQQSENNIESTGL